VTGACCGGTAPPSLGPRSKYNSCHRFPCSEREHQHPAASEPPHATRQWQTGWAVRGRSIARWPHKFASMPCLLSRLATFRSSRSCFRWHRGSQNTRPSRSRTARCRQTRHPQRVHAVTHFTGRCMTEPPEPLAALTRPSSLAIPQRHSRHERPKPDRARFFFRERSGPEGQPCPPPCVCCGDLGSRRRRGRGSLLLRLETRRAHAITNRLPWR
jgi:hypothetical protein